jgi:hypothetical protein
VSKKTLVDTLREIFGLTPKKTLQREHRAETISSLNPPHATTPSSPLPTSQQTPSTTQNLPQIELPPKIKRVEWGSSQPAPTPTKIIPSIPKTGPRIDWGDGVVHSVPNLEALIGIEDAFEHTPLLPGEQIAFCKRDKVAYHIATWEFLRQQNQGRCCICGQSNVITLYTLPGRLIEKPVIPQPVTPLTILRSGEKVISLQEVRDHVNYAITVQDYVHEVYRSQKTGTYFVRFEPRGWDDPPFAGFKVVIFPDYQSAWSKAGISIPGYQGHHICVRGVIQVHKTWGIEILINSPRVIQIVQ